MAAGGLAVLGAGRLGAEEENPWARLVSSASGYGIVRPPSFARALPIPPIKRPTRTGPQGDEIDLVLRPGSGQPVPGAATPILGFDGIWGFDHFQPMYGEGRATASRA